LKKGLIPPWLFGRSKKRRYFRLWFPVFPPTPPPPFARYILFYFYFSYLGERELGLVLFSPPPSRHAPPLKLLCPSQFSASGSSRLKRLVPHPIPPPPLRMPENFASLSNSPESVPGVPSPPSHWFHAHVRPAPISACPWMVLFSLPRPEA